MFSVSNSCQWPEATTLDSTVLHHLRLPLLKTHLSLFTPHDLALLKCHFLDLTIPSHFQDTKYPDPSPDLFFSAPLLILQGSSEA